MVKRPTSVKARAGIELAPAEPQARRPSERRILDGAVRALARRGARRLSMSDVCLEAGVSRATVYRYFATMEDLLREVADHILTTSEQGLVAAVAAQTDPLEKLRAAIGFMTDYTSAHPTTGIIEIDPVFAIEFLVAHFDRHVAGMQRAITPACEMIAESGAVPPDPKVLAQLLVRANLSTLLVPGDACWAAMADSTVEFIRANLSIDPSKAAA